MVLKCATHGGGEETAGAEPPPDRGQRAVAPPGVLPQTQTLQVEQIIQDRPVQLAQLVVLQERRVINIIRKSPFPPALNLQ